LEKIPTTISGLYAKASLFDAQFRRLREISGQNKGTFQTTKKPSVPRYVSTNDPNAMDIDRLTTEERERHMKERRCFECHKIGHQAKDCRSKPNNTPGTSNDKYQGIKKTATTARAMIRNILQEMDDEEKEKLLEEKELSQDF